MNNNYYKSSLLFAIFLHATLVLGLLIKFTTSRQVVLSPGSGFINATCINESNISGFSAPKAVKIEKSKNDASDLQKNLLTEQFKELAELKQARQEYKKIKAKQQKQQMQKILQEQLKTEQKQLIEEQKMVTNDGKSEADNIGEASKVGEMQSAGEFNEYATKIKQAISAEWVVPEGINANTSCKLLIKIAPGGIVLDVAIVESSNNSEILERSAKAAVTRASPLPVPQDLSAFDNFRVIKLNFNPSGINSITQGN